MKIASVASRSAIGGRDENQDACDVVVESGDCVAAVADGLGGHPGGATAAREAVQRWMTFFADIEGDRHAMLPDAFNAVQSELAQQQASDPTLAEMRTTLVGLVIQDGRASWGHIGDSRLYLLRAGEVLHQTRDHSVPQMLVDSGEIRLSEVRGHPEQNRLLRCLGDGDARFTLLPEPWALESGDALLLCSDGFWEYVLESELLAELTVSNDAQDWLDRLLLYLVDRVPRNHDNYTAIAMHLA